MGQSVGSRKVPGQRHLDQGFLAVFGSPAPSYIPGMYVKYWTKALREAEHELEAATTLTAVKAAAKKLQRAKAELKELERAERPKRRASRGASSGGASS
jgi:hypothetical protein